MNNKEQWYIHRDSLWRYTCPTTNKEIWFLFTDDKFCKNKIWDTIDGFVIPCTCKIVKGVRSYIIDMSEYPGAIDSATVRPEIWYHIIDKVTKPIIIDYDGSDLVDNNDGREDYKDLIESLTADFFDALPEGTLGYDDLISYVLDVPYTVESATILFDNLNKLAAWDTIDKTMEKRINSIMDAYINKPNEWEWKIDAWEDICLDDKIKKLKKKLDTLVSDEEFEEAAKIRDQINSLVESKETEA